MSYTNSFPLKPPCIMGRELDELEASAMELVEAEALYLSSINANHVYPFMCVCNCGSMLNKNGFKTSRTAMKSL